MVSDNNYLHNLGINPDALHFVVSHPHRGPMLLHHRNWPVLPPNGRAQGQPGAGVDPLSDGTGVAPTHVPTLPAATSAFNLTLCPPICPLSPVLGLHCVWEPGLQGLYYSNHQSLSWRNSIRQTKQILSPKVEFLLILEDRSLASP